MNMTAIMADGKKALNGSTGKMLFNVLYFGFGMIASNGYVFGEYSPFGISIAAAVPFPNVIFSVAGSITGYIIFGSRNFRYIAAIFAVLAIRWTFKDIKKINGSFIYSALVCAVPTFATGMAVASVSGFTFEKIFSYTLEAILAGTGAYFIARTFVIIHGTKTLGMLLPQEIVCLIMTGCIGILALSSFQIFSLSLGRMLAVICILTAAHYGGTAGGCIAGIAMGIVLGIASEEYYFLGAAYAFGGLMAGLFTPSGHIIAAVIFLLSGGLASLQAQGLTTVIQVMYEMAISGTIFAVLPKNAFNFMAALFSLNKTDKNCEGLRRSIIMRLDFASKALSGVSEDVERVSEKLSKIVTPTLESVYKKSVESTCSRCGMKVFCWEHKNGVSLDDFESVGNILRKNGEIKPEDFCEEFRRVCCRTSEMTSAVNRYYKNFLSSEAAAKRVDEIRTVVAGQFCGLGEILGEMADEYENYEVFDNSLAESVILKLKELGMMPIDASCRIDYMGRMTVEAEVFDGDRDKIKKNAVVTEISKLCGRKFDIPNITAAFGRCRIVLSERSQLDIEIAASQHVSKSGQLCGDNFSYFHDGMGRMITVLSDGMGTGGRAAVDGGMAVSIMSKLLKAGLGFDCSLKVVNAALMVKSEDESLATLDVVSVDLYNGETDFFKAGAAVSFIKKSDKMYKVETPSLPVGILPDVEFTCTEDNLHSGDIIVMLSDGALSTGDEWIEHIISSWENKSMKELADLINDEATARRNDGHDDDITVIAMKIA